MNTILKLDLHNIIQHGYYQSNMKNIIIVTVSLIGIMLVATTIVIVFNTYIGYSTDVNNDDVATSISAIAFSIAAIWKYIDDKKVS